MYTIDMHCDRLSYCFNEVKWRVSVTNSLFKKDQYTKKLNYCDKCYNNVNPEHKRIIVMHAIDISDYFYEKARDIYGYEKEDIPESYLEKHMFMIKFKRLIK